MLPPAIIRFNTSLRRKSPPNKDVQLGKGVSIRRAVSFRVIIHSFPERPGANFFPSRSSLAGEKHSAKTAVSSASLR